MNISTDFGPDSGGRVKGLTIVKPLIYGNVARSFGKKREEDGHTHQWTVYVKPYQNEDMSTYVKKIHFKLHESYANPNRVVTKPPFEVTETGWGEFEIVIKIHFHDPTERPVTMYHILKLFQSPILDGEVTTTQIEGKKGLVSEQYEEIVFQEPTQLMQQLLTNVQPVTTGAWKHDTDFEEKKVQSLENIIETKAKIKSEITLLKDKLKLARETIAKFKTEMAKVQGQQPAA
ncbi:YEATS domain containing protein 4 [Culex quinquefasciatus]|uniref:YEATS domain-containing protein 4 n=5 Tax=Culex pipiens complex TaxID=518105 RepID=B0VZZ6_CULQU|nr:YEATS domain-containing protein 4 [Culex quinquefasciatus]XP_039439062.1 YEATS domain-containing protein 4 [Culex pipiens pallens]EDS37568.1 YEATS domain containing protein 4 [Culex quinquefasciatus]|eukprot:XP_001842030.1 YEATS domain containing protein 4 [Culex quinquefasciatus]